MRIVSFLFALFFLFALSSANTCVNRYCSQPHKVCKNDPSSPPCATLVNGCLDLCPSNTDYACISFCLSKQKSQIPSKFVSCCREYHCKVQKFSAVLVTKIMEQLTQE